MQEKTLFVFWFYIVAIRLIFYAYIISGSEINKWKTNPEEDIIKSEKDSFVTSKEH